MTSRIAYRLLELTHASADAFPPLKSIAGGALYITNLVQQFRQQKAKWRELSDEVQIGAASVIGGLARNGGIRPDIGEKLTVLKMTLDKIASGIETYRNRTRSKRFVLYAQAPNMIDDLKEELNNALKSFHRDIAIIGALDVAELLDKVNKNLSTDVVDLSLQETLSKLQYAEGAGWDPNATCLPGTRQALLDKIYDWTKTSRSTAELCLLTGVAGSGKSTIAHTIAQLCKNAGILLACFFFDRDVSGRNRPDTLISTLAYALTRVDPVIRELVAAAIENDRSLLSPPLSRQFEHLILGPAYKLQRIAPLVVVLDALDEGEQEPLLKILREFRHLPGAIRVVATSRPEESVMAALSVWKPVRFDIDLDDGSNLADIREYIKHRADDLVSAKPSVLKDGWLTDQLLSDVARKAEGLFQWVTVVFDFLKTRRDPLKQLETFLSNPALSGVSPERRMDITYAQIFEKCPWDDTDFVDGYRLVIGAVIAAKRPLSSTALEMLHGERLTMPIADLLAPLASLLPGIEHKERPMRILHQSLRSFITLRAQGIPETLKYHLDEKEHNGRLAFLCVDLMNNRLPLDVTELHYLNKNGPKTPLGIPKLANGWIDECLDYACVHWISHVATMMDEPSTELMDALRIFVVEKMTYWIEIAGVIGMRVSLKSVPRQIKEFLLGEMTSMRKDTIANACFDLTKRLQYMEQRDEEVLDAIQEVAQIYQQLDADEPMSSHNLNLAISLNDLSICLSNLGRGEESLDAIQQAVEICRRFAKDTPARFNSDLAGSLSNLSVRLSELGRREEALDVTQQAIEIYRQLTSDRPVAFNPDLAVSLDNLSTHLSELGRHEEALNAAQQAVEIHQQLANNEPATFNRDLAQSLNNLSVYLSNLGRREEAIDAIQQAVEVYRWLANDRPVAFNLYYAQSLNTLSVHLSNSGRREEALDTIQEVVKVYQKLADNKPAAFNPGLAGSLSNLPSPLSYLGRHEESLDAIQRVVEIYRQLASDRTARFNPEDLVGSLNNLSASLYDLGSHDEALDALCDKLSIYQLFATERPGVLNPFDMQCLGTLSVLLTDLGRPDEAARATRQADEICQSLHAVHS